MAKNLSANYYQENNERYLKKACERYQNLSKKRKRKKSNSMVVNVTKISQKIKNKIYRKTHYRMRKIAWL